ncbi:MAG: FRG domain-containing protein [Methanobrevibacter sp.]|jgi:hypothetical protein|nr:FRG domain-containing protein [Candidatus Methanoflexus mossambicus]
MTEIFQIKKINSYSELEEFLKNHLKISLNNINEEFIFRGDSNYSDKLQPKLFRKQCKGCEKYLIDKDVNKLLYNPTNEYNSLVFKMFLAMKQNKIITDELPNINFNTITKEECKTIFYKHKNEIGLSQHNELPTIGIDFTYDLKIALYFLIAGDFKEEDDWEDKWFKKESCLWIFKKYIFEDNQSENQNLLKLDLDHQTNPNANQQDGLLVLCLDNDKKINIDDFCAFKSLNKNSRSFTEENKINIECNGVKFQNINIPIGYKILISPKVKIEIIKNFDFFKMLEVWPKEPPKYNIEKNRISIKLEEMYNNYNN